MAKHITLDEWKAAGLTYAQYKMDRHREKLVATRATRNNPVMIDVDSIKDEAKKAKIIATLGDPNKKEELEPTEPYLPWSERTGREIELAMSQYNLVKQYRMYADKATSKNKVKLKHEFVDLVKGGYIMQTEYQLIGKKLSFQTIERWDNKLRNGKNVPDDLFGPIRQKQEDQILTPAHIEILKTCLLQKNKPRKAEVIRNALAAFAAKGMEIPSSYKCGAWVDKYCEDFAATTKLIRESRKLMRDGMMPYIDRDIDQINFMDVMVADGHTFNDMVINPTTGKPARPTMIAWLDMRTLMIMGYEIMFTENTMGIASAFRMACVNAARILGIDGAVLPRMVYMDNGKAFRSKFFNSAPDLEGNIGGLFDRLMIHGLEHVSYAKPYNADAKVIERVFGILGEFERRLPTYSGYNIDNKPANMKRAEPLAKEIFNQHIEKHGYPTLYEFYGQVQQWMTEYNNRVGNGKYLNGHSPVSLAAQQMDAIDFSPRFLPANELSMMMMHQKVMKLNAMGFCINKRWYYNRLKFPQKDKNTYWLVKWDMFDLERILVFKEDGTFWCEAKLSINQGIHPAAALGSDADRQKLADAIDFVEGIVKDVEDHARKELGLPPKATRNKQLALAEAKQKALPENDEFNGGIKKLSIPIERQGQEPIYELKMF